MEDKIADLTGGHLFHLHRYGTRTLNRILADVIKAESKATGEISVLLESLTAKERADYIAGVYKRPKVKRLKKIIDDLGDSVRAVIAARAKLDGAELAAYEASFTDKLMTALVEVPEYKTVVASEAIRRAMKKPILGRLVAQSLKDQSTAIQRQVSEAIREGMVSGEGVGAIVRRIRGTKAENYRNGILGGKTHSRIETLTRTFLNHVANVAREDTFTAIGVEKVQWLSVLDGRTSKICATRDLKIYPINEGPRPPAHPNCRSTIKPYLGVSGGKRPFVAHDKPLSKVKPNERDVGQVMGGTNFEKFFARRSAAFQKDWLGPTRYKLYKSGDYKLTRFVDPRTGREHSISKLKAADAALFEELGL